jgi:hypothetical protein
MSPTVIDICLKGMDSYERLESTIGAFLVRFKKHCASPVCCAKWDQNAKPHAT